MLGELTLEDLLQAHTASLAHPLPLWSVFMGPGDSIHVLVVVMNSYGAPEDLDYIILAGLDTLYLYVDSFDMR